MHGLRTSWKSPCSRSRRSSASRGSSRRTTTRPRSRRSTSGPRTTPRSPQSWRRRPRGRPRTRRAPPRRPRARPLRPRRRRPLGPPRRGPRATKRRMTRRSPSAAAAAAAAPAAAQLPPGRSKGPSTTARRATGCGSTPPSRTTRSTPSTGPATGRSTSPSRPTASSSAAPAMTTTTSSQELYARILAFDRVVQTRMSTRAVPTAHGTAFFFDPHPNIWDRNLLALDAVDVPFAELAAEADEVQRGLPHRMVTFDGEAGHHADEARAAGWGVERHIAMVAVRPPDHETVGHPVREVGGAALAEARRRGVADEIWARRDPATVDAVLAVDARLREVVTERGFASFDGGRPAGVAYLYSDDDNEVGQVEDVLTIPAHRGHGHGRAVVLTALAASRSAGHRMTFLWADEGDWPKALYVKLGFEVVGRRWRFRRVVGARRSP